MWTSRLLNNTIRKIIPSTSMKPSITDTTITPITLHSGSFTFGGGTTSFSSKVIGGHQSSTTCRIVGYFAEEVYIFVKYGNVILNFADN